MIRFENLNKSPMTLSSPKWQEDVVQRVNKEYQDKAIEASENIRREFSAIEHSIQAGFYAKTFEQILRQVPRFDYIKNIRDSAGVEYEAEIDLVLHTISFYEV